MPEEESIERRDRDRQERRQARQQRTRRTHDDKSEAMQDSQEWGLPALILGGWSGPGQGACSGSGRVYSGAEMRAMVVMASGHFRPVVELLHASVPFSPRHHRSIFFMGLPWEIREHTGGVNGGNCSQLALSLPALWRWPWWRWCQRPWWHKWGQIILLQAQMLLQSGGSFTLLILAVTRGLVR